MRKAQQKYNSKVKRKLVSFNLTKERDARLYEILKKRGLKFSTTVKNLIEELYA